MSATVAVALKKVAIYILGDEKKRGKLFCSDRKHRRRLSWTDVPACSCAVEHGQYGNRAT